jgi:saccharopine dehydrogenase (NADP+, L-glutamate forming)
VDEKVKVKEMFGWLGLFDGTKIPDHVQSPAAVLQYAMENKLSLFPKDKDMIVMLHEFEYEVDGQRAAINSSLVVKGENSVKTAMAKTVGLPLGIAAKLILNGTIKSGLAYSVTKDIYEPVLKSWHTI